MAKSSYADNDDEGMECVAARADAGIVYLFACLIWCY